MTEKQKRLETELTQQKSRSERKQTKKRGVDGKNEQGKVTHYG